MPMMTATARANSNIALIKYWGNRDDGLRLPASGSISMNLDGLHTQTTVTLTPGEPTDQIRIGGEVVSGAPAARVSGFLDIVRQMAHSTDKALVVSANNFPTGAGIASSASAFAALALAGASAYGLDLDERALSSLARRGSGSASRSVPTAFVEWYVGDTHASSYAESIAPVDHWALVDCVAIVSSGHKETGSTEGHAIAATSPLQTARLATAPQRLDECRRAVLDRDFARMAAVVELDSTIMHSVMMTGTPALFYWKPPTLAVMAEVRAWRAAGIPVCTTIDAGANVHCLCEAQAADTVQERLRAIPGVTDVLRAGVGGPARLIPDAD